MFVVVIDLLLFLSFAPKVLDIVLDAHGRFVQKVQPHVPVGIELTSQLQLAECPSLLQVPDGTQVTLAFVTDVTLVVMDGQMALSNNGSQTH